MRLLYVIHQFFPECHSGTEQYCLALSREARRCGHDVTILSFDPRYSDPDPVLEVREERYEEFRVLKLRHWNPLQPNSILRDYHNPLIADRFSRLLEQLRPAAIHFFHLRNLGSDLLATAHAAGLVSVVHLMDFWWICPRFTLLRSDGTLCDGPPEGGLGCVPCNHADLADPREDADALATARACAEQRRELPAGASRADLLAAVILRKRVQLERLALADHIVAPSKFLAEMFARNGFSRALEVVPYGLEASRVRHTEVQRPRDPLRVAFAGVLSPWKAPDIAVRAVLQLPGRLELRVHGRTDEPMFQSYIDGVRELAAGDSRISFPGAFAEDDLSRVLADTDLLVVPSAWYENTPFVILEAFAAGVPVAASDLGGMSEIVVPGVNGFLFSAGDPDALAGVLESIRVDPGLLRALEPRAPASIADNFELLREMYASRTGAPD